MEASDRFQGQCYASRNGHEYMHIYDRLEPQVRAALQSSNFNICTACVIDEAGRVAGSDFRRPGHYLIAIQNIERAIRSESN